MNPAPFHTFDHFGNEYVIQHGNVPTDVPTTVVLWPLAAWEHSVQRFNPSTGGWEPSTPLPFYIGPVARLLNVVLRRQPAAHSHHPDASAAAAPSPAPDTAEHGTGDGA